MMRPHPLVPRASRRNFKLTAADDEVDEFLLEKLEKELFRLEDVHALLSPMLVGPARYCTPRHRHAF